MLVMVRQLPQPLNLSEQPRNVSIFLLKRTDQRFRPVNRDGRSVTYPCAYLCDAVGQNGMSSSVATGSGAATGAAAAGALASRPLGLASN